MRHLAADDRVRDWRLFPLLGALGPACSAVQPRFAVGLQCAVFCSVSVEVMSLPLTSSLLWQLENLVIW